MVRDGKVYVFQGDALVLPREVPDSSGARGLPLGRVRRVFGALPLFSIGAGDRWGADLDAAAALPPAWRLLPVRSALSLEASGPTADSGPTARCFRAFHLAQWRRESAYCGSCGSPNGEAPGELARRCPACGRVEYPRISPAVITLIQREDGRVLLAHNRRFAPGVYSLIAGFVEAGETLEAAAIREIREEVRLEVGALRYVRSQPWPFPNSLMLGFQARYLRGDIQVDGEEIEDARWFSREDLPALPGAGSVSRCLIERWREGAL